MVSEKDSAFLRERNARYLVGTPKAQLRDFESALLDNEGWRRFQSGLEARLVAHADGKGEKECAMLTRIYAVGVAAYGLMNFIRANWFVVLFWSVDERQTSVRVPFALSTVLTCTPSAVHGPVARLLVNSVE